MHRFDRAKDVCGFALLCWTTLIPATVHALDTTYVYVGNGFDTFIDEPIPEGSYSADSSVSIRLTVDNPLGPGLTDEAIVPLSYIVSDGRKTITQASAGYPSDQVFIVSTNAGGEIIAWSISVTTNRIWVFDWEAISSVSDGATALDEASITVCTLPASFCLQTGTDFGSIAGNPGTWSKASFELLTPLDLSSPCTAPTFSWGAGDNDLYYVFTRFYYKGAGYLSRGIFTAVTSFEMPDFWWSLIDGDQPSSWAVVGINRNAGTYEISDTWTFTKPFSGPLDPTGTWIWQQDWSGTCGSLSFDATLTVDSCGNYSSAVGSGTWLLAGDQVTLDSGVNVVFTGTINDTSDHMEGTATDSNAPGLIACWSAERSPSASAGSL